MGQIRNPFTPTFGMVPPYLAGRDRVLSDMRRAFSEGLGNPNLATLLVGPRGSGKTALLSCIADEATQEGWINVNAVALEGMLDDIIQQAGKACAHLVEPVPTRRLSAVGIGQLLNLEWVFSPESQASWRLRIEALLDQIGAHARGLLITVDEVRPEVDELVQLIATYQLLVRDGRQVALVMAGLPSDVGDLIDDRRVTFLRRARQSYVGRIGDEEIRSAFLKTVENAGKHISDEALCLAVDAIDGFAYMMQLVGYFTWYEAEGCSRIEVESVRRGVARAREDFERGVLDATYRELSAGDLAFAQALLACGGTSSLAEVARRLGKSTSYASNYKRRLMRQGIVGELPDRSLTFEMPFFARYLAARM